MDRRRQSISTDLQDHPEFRDHLAKQEMLELKVNKESPDLQDLEDQKVNPDRLVHQEVPELMAPTDLRESPEVLDLLDRLVCQEHLDLLDREDLREVREKSEPLELKVPREMQEETVKKVNPV